MKRYILIHFLLLSFSAYSQNTINHYKYVVVPEKFSFLKQNDQYSLNSLTKGLLEDKGFTVYFDNSELPTELANNKCRALSAEVLESSGMFTTNLTLILKDCQGNILFTSKEGKSREKEYGLAYRIALRDAFTSLNKVSYTANTGSTNEPSQPITETTTSDASVKSNGALTSQPGQPLSTKTASETTVKSTEMVTRPAGTLYAQAIANGYQLIDTAPKIVLTLLKTSAENYFIASNGIDNGIVLKKNDDWVFEYYKDGKLMSEKLLVKF
jgi:hypothetical protein